MKTDHLLFGAAYYSEYLPYDRVEKAGMNTIRIAESTWSTIEPKDGIFDFTHLDKMLEAAARHHISVIVGTPTYAVPAWLAKKYPDMLALTNNGQNIYGARQNMDITHAGYLFHCERVIRAMMEHIKDVPHIIGFQLDNETKSYGTAGLRVQAMFVDYLRKNTRISMNSIASSDWTTGATASTHGKISRMCVARSMKALPLNLPNSSVCL